MYGPGSFRQTPSPCPPVLAKILQNPTPNTADAVENAVDSGGESNQRQLEADKSNPALPAEASAELARNKSATALNSTYVSWRNPAERFQPFPEDRDYLSYRAAGICVYHKGGISSLSSNTDVSSAGYYACAHQATHLRQCSESFCSSSNNYSCSNLSRMSKVYESIPDNEEIYSRAVPFPEAAGGRGVFVVPLPATRPTIPGLTEQKDNCPGCGLPHVEQAVSALPSAPKLDGKQEACAKSILSKPKNNLPFAELEKGIVSPNQLDNILAPAKLEKARSRQERRNWRSSLLIGFQTILALLLLSFGVLLAIWRVTAVDVFATMIVAGAVGLLACLIATHDKLKPRHCLKTCTLALAVLTAISMSLTPSLLLCYSAYQCRLPIKDRSDSLYACDAYERHPLEIPLYYFIPVGFLNAVPSPTLTWCDAIKSTYLRQPQKARLRTGLP